VAVADGECEGLLRHAMTEACIVGLDGPGTITARTLSDIHCGISAWHLRPRQSWYKTALWYGQPNQQFARLGLSCVVWRGPWRRAEAGVLRLGAEPITWTGVAGRLKVARSGECLGSLVVPRRFRILHCGRVLVRPGDPGSSMRLRVPLCVSCSPTSDRLAEIHYEGQAFPFVLMERTSRQPPTRGALFDWQPGPEGNRLFPGAVPLNLPDHDCLLVAALALWVRSVKTYYV